MDGGTHCEGVLVGGSDRGVVAEAEPTLRLLLRDATELGVELRRPDTELGGDVSCAQRRVVALARFGIR